MAHVTLDRIRQIAIFKELPESQLAWLLDKSSVKKLKQGDIYFDRGDAIDHFGIVLEGEINIYLHQGENRKLVSVLRTDDLTGVLPYSRLKEAIGTSIAARPTQMLELHRQYLDEMIRDHFELTQALVHFMTSRVREFSQMQSQNEKLAALGKLSAGLAHELNNPASAMVRSAEALNRHLHALPDNFKAVIKIRLTDEQVDAVNSILFSRLAEGPAEGMSLLDRTEKEEELGAWLEDYGLDDGFDLAEVLVTYGFELDDLEEVREICGLEHFPPVLRWMVNNVTTESMVVEIQEAATRIADLVGAIKSYSYMDRDADRQEVDINAGIRNTLKMLHHKLEKAGHRVVLHLDENLPKIEGLPGELNQVWTNLMDNAADAMDGTNGTLTVSTSAGLGQVRILIEDTGSGIPPEVVSKIFEPFYTTKEMGKGTGLGLDIVRKIIDQHRGTIQVDSKPGSTQFEMVIPVGTK